MNTHVDKTQENKNHIVMKESSNKKSGAADTIQLIDNRPETIMQRRLQEMANNQFAQPVQKQEIEEEELLQGKFKTPEVSGQAIQKQEIEEEELLQGKFKPIQKEASFELEHTPGNPAMTADIGVTSTGTNSGPERSAAFLNASAVVQRAMTIGDGKTAVRFVKRASIERALTDAVDPDPIDASISDLLYHWAKNTEVRFKTWEIAVQKAKRWLSKCEELKPFIEEINKGWKALQDLEGNPLLAENMKDEYLMARLLFTVQYNRVDKNPYASKESWIIVKTELQKLQLQAFQTIASGTLSQNIQQMLRSRFVEEGGMNPSVFNAVVETYAGEGSLGAVGGALGEGSEFYSKREIKSKSEWSTKEEKPRKSREQKAYESAVFKDWYIVNMLDFVNTTLRDCNWSANTLVMTKPIPTQVNKKDVIEIQKTAVTLFKKGKKQIPPDVCKGKTDKDVYYYVTKSSKSEYAFDVTVHDDKNIKQSNTLVIVHIPSGQKYGK